MRFILPVLALLAAAAPAQAQTADACATFKFPVATAKAALAAGAPVAQGAIPALGAAATVPLRPQASVAYTVAPTHVPRFNPAYGTELALPAQAAPGRLQVALSDDGWVDVVQGGKLVRSVGFSGVKGCAGIRKLVRFPVRPGSLSLVISDSPDETVTVVVELLD